MRRRGFAIVAVIAVLALLLLVFAVLAKILADDLAEPARPFGRIIAAELPLWKEAIEASGAKAD